MRARTFLRWTARLGVGVLALAVAGAGAVYGLSERRFGARFEVPDHPLAVRDDAATIALGRHIATTRGCGDCHGEQFTGRVLVDDPAIGRLAGPNLTRGGRGAELTPADWERAVRHGVRRDGSPLLFMPSHEYTHMTDEDLGAVVAYVRTLPGDTAVAPPTKAGPVGRALFLAGQVDFVPAEKVDHRATHLASLTPEPTVGYGKYLAEGCTGCHGPGYSGGKIPGTPPDWKPAANISPAGIGRWTQADFTRALRQGRRPDGSMIDTTIMPVRATKAMTDVEIQALWAYLRTVPAKPYGGR